jgi:hypothetical protein
MVAGNVHANMPMLTDEPRPSSPAACKEWAAKQDDEALEMWGIQEDGKSSRGVGINRLASYCMGQPKPEIVGFGSSAGFDRDYCKKHQEQDLCTARPKNVTSDTSQANPSFAQPSEEGYPTDKLVPWRNIRVLNDPTTQLIVEGEKGKVYRISGGIRGYLLNGEKGGPAVNICRAFEKGANLFLRCDRKGGFRDGPSPRPWWWRYEAVIEGSTVRIVSVSQKDGPFERGERVSEHFHDDIE